MEIHARRPHLSEGQSTGSPFQWNFGYTLRCTACGLARTTVLQIPHLHRLVFGRGGPLARQRTLAYATRLAVLQRTNFAVQWGANSKCVD